MNEWVWSNGGMILTGENWSTGRKTCSSSSLLLINLTWTVLGSNPGLCGQRPPTNHPIQSSRLRLKRIIFQYLFRTVQETHFLYTSRTVLYQQPDTISLEVKNFIEIWSRQKQRNILRSSCVVLYLVVQEVTAGMFGLTLRLLMSYIYGAPIFYVSRSHTTTQHSR